MVPAVRLTPKGSSNIAWIHLSEDETELTIQFHPNGLYRYTGPELLGGHPIAGGETLAQRFGTMVRGNGREDFSIGAYVRRHITGHAAKKDGTPEHRPYACERLAPQRIP
ncbi:MAG TPA: hypothetical protein VG944_13155 [Fimbriimonas sp.]|nr:hypothetical protein [Fimbriimonas sp.]